jgi:ketosteroid isomerase-like protein
MTVDTTTDIEANKKLVKEFHEVFSTGDVDNILSYMAPDATWWVAGSFGMSGTYDVDGMRTLFSGVGDSVKGGAIRLTPTAMTAEGERVAVETESYAELTNGRVYNNLYHFLFVVRDGKIHQVKEYLDTIHTNEVFFGE